MDSKLKNIILKTYNGGVGEIENKEADDTSTVDTDTSELMKRLEGDGENEDDEDKSIVMDSDEENDITAAANVAIETEDSDADESDISDAEDNEELPLSVDKKTKTPAVIKPVSSEVSEDESESDTDDEDYLQKLDDSVRQNIIGEYHPEMIHHNDEEVETLCKIVRDADGVIIDPFHKTLPFVTKYEKARILGERAKQINSGAKPFISVEKHIIDGYLIALREFEEKKIPFIVRRPLPNGGSEYWKLADLQILD